MKNESPEESIKSIFSLFSNNPVIDGTSLLNKTKNYSKTTKK
jgi:hypothetical protein